MIKILKKVKGITDNDDKTHKTRCPICNTRFSYQGKDSIYVAMRYQRVVDCPECGNSCNTYLSYEDGEHPKVEDHPPRGIKNENIHYNIFNINH